MRQDFYPLAENPEIQRETYEKLGIKNPAQTEQELIEEIMQER